MDLTPEQKAWIDERLAEGRTPEQVLAEIAQLQHIAREEKLGLIERVTQPDGSAIIYDRDPFAHLPVTDDEEE